MIEYNPWYGCHKKSPGCRNCFAEYVLKEHFNKVTKAKSFYNIKTYPQKSKIMVALLSDFYISDADDWRDEVWEMIKDRSDCEFTIVTKFPERIAEHTPEWVSKAPNLAIAVTMENELTRILRSPFIKDLPFIHKLIFAQPLQERLNLLPLLRTGMIDQVNACGEVTEGGEITHYTDFQALLHDCISADVNFKIGLTGTNFQKETLSHYPSIMEQAMVAAKLQLFYKSSTRPMRDTQMYFDWTNLVLNDVNIKPST
jgi:protein gp37